MMYRSGVLDYRATCRTSTFFPVWGIIVSNSPVISVSNPRPHETRNNPNKATNGKQTLIASITMGTPRLLCEGSGHEFEFEYVDRATSEMLLDKFADMSAYDFNYEESAIWSPLNPRVYNSTNTHLCEIKPKKRKQPKPKQQGKLMRRFFKRSSRMQALNSSASSFASAQKAHSWTRLLRVASRCFKSGRPSLSSSSVRFLNLPKEISLSEPLH